MEARVTERRCRGNLPGGSDSFATCRRSCWCAAERLPVVHVRERLVGHGDTEERAQRLPALA